MNLATFLASSTILILASRTHWKSCTFWRKTWQIVLSHKNMAQLSKKSGVSGQKLAVLCWRRLCKALVCSTSFNFLACQCLFISIRFLLSSRRYDLKIARADNEVDMRYMINLEYTIDLPITTMGRRVRTRLYFTSESHLHTMLNVLRFAKDRTSVLSEEGVNILNDTGELCYLTQILLRLFEDRRWEMDDPRYVFF